MREGNDVPPLVLWGNAITLLTCYVCYFVALMFRRTKKSNQNVGTEIKDENDKIQKQLRVHYWCFTVSKIAFAAGLVCFNFSANP